MNAIFQLLHLLRLPSSFPPLSSKSPLHTLLKLSLPSRLDSFTPTNATRQSPPGGPVATYGRATPGG
jgi:hypothetical protein